MQKHEYEWDLNRKIANVYIPEGESESDAEILLKVFQLNRRMFSGVSIVFLLMGIFTLFWQILPDVRF